MHFSASFENYRPSATMIAAAQMTFDTALGLLHSSCQAMLNNSALSIETANYRPPGLVGDIELRQLQAEGWAFRDRGIWTADSWAVWGRKDDVRKLFFLACPERFPQLWPQDEVVPHGTQSQADSTNQTRPGDSGAIANV